MDIPEALLEMHYYEPLSKLFEEHFGSQVVRIIKPTQPEEKYLGFDQGWVVWDREEGLGSVKDNLAAVIKSAADVSPGFAFGYFLQFKVVEETKRCSAELQSQGFTSPYRRVRLSTKKNKSVGYSQHEALVRLTAAPGAEPSYACPMIFTEDRLLDRSRALEWLRIVPVSGAPAGYLTDGVHHLAFRDDKDHNPIWCSEPHEGEALVPVEWRSRFGRRPVRLSELPEWIGSFDRSVLPLPKWAESLGRGAILPEALTILLIR